MGSFIRIGLGIEEGESSLCGGAPRAVIPDGILKCPDPACTHLKTYLYRLYSLIPRLLAASVRTDVLVRTPGFVPLQGW